MKRILLFLCLFTISFNLIASSESDPRKFITGFFQAIKDIDWKLSPQKSLAFLGFPQLASDAEVFLEAEDLKLSKEGFDKFFKGLLTGVSAVPFDQNKCYKEVSGSLDEIKAAAMKVYEAVINKSPKSFTDALAELTASLLKIKDYDQNCNVTQLIKSLSIYSASYVGLGKFIYNIVSNGPQYYELSKEMFQAVKEESFEKGGVASGNIIRILLSWETK